MEIPEDLKPKKKSLVDVNAEQEIFYDLLDKINSCSDFYEREQWFSNDQYIMRIFWDRGVWDYQVIYKKNIKNIDEYLGKS